MAGGGKKTQYDYATMQHEFVTTDISIRELAAKHGVKSASSVSAQSRRGGWEQLRSNFKSLQNERTAEAVAAKRAKQIADMEEDFFKTVHGAILKLGVDLHDQWVTDPVSGERRFIPGQRVSPEGLTKLIDKFLVMTGNVTSREAHLGLDVSVAAEDIPPDVLRELRRLALSKGAGAEPVGQSPLPGISGAKQVN